MNESAIHGLAGGVLIGAGSLLASVATGKIPGISGLVARILRPTPGDVLWRVVFLAGLVLGAGIAFAVSTDAAVFQPRGSLIAMAVAGALVGLGARLGGGCTSGHGICGMGLGSRDAIVATLVFMAAGMGTVYLHLHCAGGVR
jgi:uncharacterized membrane protein YedE/YeeE